MVDNHQVKYLLYLFSGSSTCKVLLAIVGYLSKYVLPSMIALRRLRSNLTSSDASSTFGKCAIHHSFKCSSEYFLFSILTKYQSETKRQAQKNSTKSIVLFLLFNRKDLEWCQLIQFCNHFFIFFRFICLHLFSKFVAVCNVPLIRLRTLKHTCKM